MIDRRRCRGSGTVSVIGDFMYKTMHEGPYAYNVWLIDAFVFSHMEELVTDKIIIV